MVNVTLEKTQGYLVSVHYYYNEKNDRYPEPDNYVLKDLRYLNVMLTRPETIANVEFKPVEFLDFTEETS